MKEIFGLLIIIACKLSTVFALVKQMPPETPWDTVFSIIRSQFFAWGFTIFQFLIFIFFVQMQIFKNQ
ncbi:hypothetical protein CPATCC_0025470 [Cryptosporidium parvum]|uniref:Uncharacterized protein n=1 Tax=Cryptosporidium parvum TaxID=5807 RepID=A0A7S7LGI9_CRYPV|nr:hypothetical protein CPATCC_0025470 [Cryptosporidium parvum]|eukprot:QOY41797.1 hypothetical protein CPATCC_002397 [Cryptosporidium parvum]